MDDVLIRPEKADDVAAIARITEAAFGRADEAVVVETIRASEHYLPELSLVAERAGDIIGHVMVSFVLLHTGSGVRRVLQLAPVSVEPAHQSGGVGSALIREALARADAMREPVVLVLGHAGYYPRFGFEPGRALGIEPPSQAIADNVWMARRLSSYTADLRGTVEFTPAFA
jgi:putative acetyltransferase